MNKNIEIHPAQAEILKKLVFQPLAKFAELNILSLPTDHFSFHLRSLIEADLIQKTEGGYELTAIGKEFANRLDVDAKKVAHEQQAKVSALVIGLRAKGEVRQFLVQQRLKQPYYGYLGFISGKIKKGEKALEAAKRELKEEANLTGKLKFLGIEHKIDHSSTKELLEDKFFFIFLAMETRGRFKEEFEGGKNLWLSEREILRFPDHFPDMFRILKVVKAGKLDFFENRYLGVGF
jgi:8-oxo-dGTP pyrophosphatase MutT (NUDIX family)